MELQNTHEPDLAIDQHTVVASELTNGTGGGQIVEGSYTVYKNPTVPFEMPGQNN